MTMSPVRALVAAAAAAAALVLVAAQPARQPSESDILYQRGQQAYFGAAGARKDYAEAVRLWGLAGDMGSVMAQHNLGATYQQGIGGAVVPKNLTAAAYWYGQAAAQGYGQSQTMMGLIYLQGAGVAKDPAEAVRRYTQAANQGEAKGQYNLAVLYANGAEGVNGVSRNYEEATYWLTLAARQNNSNAEKALAQVSALCTGDCAAIVEQRLADFVVQDACQSSDLTRASYCSGNGDASPSDKPSTCVCVCDTDGLPDGKIYNRDCSALVVGTRPTAPPTQAPVCGSYKFQSSGGACQTCDNIQCESGTEYRTGICRDSTNGCVRRAACRAHAPPGRRAQTGVRSHRTQVPHAAGAADRVVLGVPRGHLGLPPGVHHCARRVGGGALEGTAPDASRYTV